MFAPIVFGIMKTEEGRKEVCFMSNHVEYEETVGFVPWMERNVLSKFRDNNGRYIAVIGVMLLALLCMIGIADEAGGEYEGFLDGLMRFQSFLFLGTAWAFRALKDSKASLKKQTIWFLIGAACGLFVVASSVVMIALYYIP